MEDILGVIVITCIVVILTLAFLLLFWAFFTTPYFKYKLYKKTNKIQWKCEETWESKEDRLNNKRTDYECSLSYRILPSEINKFVRIFGDNSWIYPFHTNIVFKNQEEFKKYVSNFVTYGDIKSWVSEENNILWYEP